MSRRDDIARYLVPPPGASLDYGQGLIRSWNPDTFENVIEFRGELLENVSVQSGAEALTYKPGDVVGLQGWAPNERVGSWWITGRIIIPGTGSAENAISWLSGSLAETIVEQITESWLLSELGQEIARTVIAETVHTDFVNAEGVLSASAGNDTGFVDLDDPGGGISPGPEITFTTETGRWILMMFANTGVPTDGGGARLGYEVTGDQTLSADNSRSALTGSQDASTAFVPSVLVRSHNGSPGEVTVTAKYRLIASASFPAGVSYENRAIIVIAY